MMRSLYSGVSGLRVHQTKMDVIGNNIANVNTVGFKASNVIFSDILYQTTASASGPNADTGRAGMNAKQIGLGATLSSIKMNINQAGGAQRTDNPFDIMIEGNAFFVVNSGSGNYFTKNGAFDIDANGNLCTTFGANVMGWQPDPNDPTKIVADQVSALRIMSPENMTTPPESTTNTFFYGNVDETDPQVAPNQGRPLTMQFYDELGNLYTAKFALTQTTSKEKYTVSLKDVVDSNGKSILIQGAPGSYTAGSKITLNGVDFTATNINANTGEFEISTGTFPELEFDASTGAFKSIGGAGKNSIKFKVTDANAAATTKFSEIDMDFSKTTKVNTGGKSTISNSLGSVDNVAVGAGKKVGNMTDFSVDGSGKIYGVYDNGDIKLLGQIAVASFTNPAGLEAIGNGLFGATQNSGVFDGVGQDIGSAGGKMSTGVLEMSNVDLSAQFTEMITTQRGFQANSRIITTSDTLLEELINLKR